MSSGFRKSLGKGFSIGVLSCCLAVLLCFSVTDAKSKKVVYYNKLSFRAKVQSDSKIKLTWKKKVKNVQAVITRTETESKKKTKIKVDAGKGTYTDRVSFNQSYRYTIKIKKKEKKKTIVHECVSRTVATKPAEVNFRTSDGYEYEKYRPVVTENFQVKIGAEVGTDAVETDGLTPSGYVIYRSNDNLTYQIIGESEVLPYTDTTTERGKIYFYQIKPYYVYQGEKVYGVMSEVAKVHVANRKPEFDISFEDSGEDDDSFIIKVHSSEYNPDLDFLEAGFSLPFVETKDGTRRVMEYKIIAHRIDDEEIWETENVFRRLKSGSNLYLLLRPTGQEWDSKWRGVEWVVEYSFLTVGEWMQTRWYRYLYISAAGPDYLEIGSEGYDWEP